MAELPPLVLPVDDQQPRVALNKAAELFTELEQIRLLVADITKQVETLHVVSPEQTITPSAAVYAFMGYLLSQNPPVTFGVGCHVGKGISLAGQFCQIQEWGMPQEGFSEAIKPWNKKEESA